MSYIPSSSSVVAFQGNPSVLQVLATVTNPQSVSGTVGASIIGLPPVNVVGTPSISGAVTVVGNPSISGTVDIGIIPGSVIAFKGGDWAITNSSVVSISVGSIITVNQGSSIIAINSGSVIAVPSGSVISLNIGSVITVNKDSSVLAVPVGSTITVFQNSSLIAVNAGSVIAVPMGSTIAVLQSPSIVGTYAEDAGHTQSDKGLFVLGVRNDTLSSITSADLDYSPIAVGPSGETIVANAPLTKRVSGTADLRVVLGASVTAIAAQGASIFTYISGVQVVNLSSASVLVTLGGGLGSTLGYTIAPGGGGSNIVYPNYLKTGENSAFTASISGTASVLLSAQGFISKS